MERPDEAESLRTEARRVAKLARAIAVGCELPSEREEAAAILLGMAKVLERRARRVADACDCAPGATHTRRRCPFREVRP